MTKHNNVHLNSAEQGGLWANYLADSMAKCILTHFFERSEDKEIKDILKMAVSLSDSHVAFIKDLYAREGIVLPIGFSSEDVNPGAPHLFSDIFSLYYLENMVTMGLRTYGNFLSGVSRKDIREYTSECLRDTIDLYNKVTQMQLERGIEIRAPYLSYADKSGFVESKQFIAGWWGEQRPLTAAEVANLFVNLHESEVQRALMIAFSQTAQSQEVKDHMKRGKNIYEKHIEIYSGMLKESDLPAPASPDNEVTESDNWTFSDRLMMFQIALLGEKSIINFGVSISISHRRDLAATYLRLLGELAKFMADGARIMIQNHWLEMPPMAIDRDQL